MRTLDINEAAAFLRLHPHTLEAKARSGQIPGAKPGKCWVFIDEDLADWLRSKYRTAGPKDEAPSQSTGMIASGGESGKSAAKRLEALLNQRTKKPRRNTAGK